MAVVQIAGAAVGFLIIAVTVWKLLRNGIARSNGKVESLDVRTGRNTEWLGDGLPPA